MTSRMKASVYQLPILNRVVVEVLFYLVSGFWVPTLH